MKWVYDENKAREHLREYQDAVAQENERRKEENKRVNTIFFRWIIGIVSAVVILALICWAVCNEPDLAAGLSLGLVLLGVVAGAFVAYWRYEETWDFLNEESQRWWKAPPADVEYLLATDGKKVLSRTLSKDCQEMDVWVTLEDENHFVSSERAGYLKRMVSTAVTEPVADLENGVYLIPYKARTERR